MDKNLAAIGVFGFLAFYFLICVTRLAYFTNDFFQIHHMLLGFTCLALAAIIFALNYHKGKKG